MARYLVVAHQTADSFELREALAAQGKADPGAEFTLLVPITYAGFLLAPKEGDEMRVVARARRVGDAAQKSLQEAGINVNRVLIGDELPVIALEEELNDEASEYAGIIFATLLAAGDARHCHAGRDAGRAGPGIVANQLTTASPAADRVPSHGGEA